MEAIIARAVQVLIALGGAYLVALWFALVVWTFQDIQLRSRSVIAQIFSTLVVMLFFVPGVLIYLILRPRETLDDAFQRSLEEEYLLQDLEELPLCPTCHRYVDADFVYCPHCRTHLRQPCVSCSRLVDLRWSTCPYCGADQYAEEEPAYERAGRVAAVPDVGRFVSKARSRFAGRRATGEQETEVTQPVVRESVAWQADETVAVRRPNGREPAESPAPNHTNGHHNDNAYVTGGNADDTTEQQTEEFPIGQAPPS